MTILHIAVLCRLASEFYSNHSICLFLSHSLSLHFHTVEHNHTDDTKRITAAQNNGCLMIRQISSIGVKTDAKFNFSTGFTNITDTQLQNFNALQNEVDSAAVYDPNQ